jgi:hypothetical protein
MYTGAVSRPGRLANLLVVPLVGLTCSWAGAQEVVEATLDNGLRVLLQEDHRSPVASFQVWYRVGSRDERVGLTGLSHYLEHMMFKGTLKYGPRVYSKLIETVGGQDNAFTSRDTTVYHVTLAAEQLDLVLELEADRMRHLLLDPREITPSGRSSWRSGGRARRTIRSGLSPNSSAPSPSWPTRIACRRSGSHRTSSA